MVLKTHLRIFKFDSGLDLSLSTSVLTGRCS